MKKSLLPFLIGISWLMFLPTIFIYASNTISYSLLYPLQICHQYNGNDFGTFPLCNTFPAFSYFGYIFAMTGILVILPIVGVVTILSYFGIIFIHNKRYPNETWKYSGSMKLLVVLLVLLSALLSFITAIAALVHIVGVTVYKLFKKETTRKYDRWLIVLLLLILALQLPRFLLLILA